MPEPILRPDGTAARWAHPTAISASAARACSFASAGPSAAQTAAKALIAPATTNAARYADGGTTAWTGERGEHAGQRGDADGAAHAARHVVEGRCVAHVRMRDGAEGDRLVGELRADHREPGEECEYAEHPQVGSRTGRHAEPERGQREADAPREHHAACADPSVRARRELRADQEADRLREHHQSGLERGQTERPLEIERADEEEPGERSHGEGDDDVGVGEVRHLEQAQAQKRLVQP